MHRQDEGFQRRSGANLKVSDQGILRLDHGEALILVLVGLDPGPSATGRLRNALWIARHKCKVKIPKPTNPAASGAVGGGRAQRRKRVRTEEEER
jgi:hypothetical protein